MGGEWEAAARHNHAVTRTENDELREANEKLSVLVWDQDHTIKVLRAEVADLKQSLAHARDRIGAQSEVITGIVEGRCEKKEVAP
jgi:hypothetical protein